MKQLIFLFLGVAAFIIAVGVYSKTPTPKKNTLVGSQALTKKEITIGTTKVSVEVADDEGERKKGLGGRSELKEGEGMLFIFPERSSNLVFWMKDMSFPIDIIWIGEDMRIVYIKKNALPESYPEVFTSDQDAQYVLEVVSRFSEENNLKEEDEVEFLPF